MTPATTAAGFSIIVAGLVGVLTVLIGIVASAWYSQRRGTLLVGAILCSGGLLAVAQSQCVSRSVVGGAVLVGAILCGWALRSRHRRVRISHLDAHDILLASGCVLVVVLMGSLLSYRAVAGEFSGVFAHATGYVTGIVWSFLMTRC